MRLRAVHCLYVNTGTVAIATVDVEGYFTGSGGSLYNPITPTRVCSTIDNLPPPYAMCNGQPQSNNEVLNVKVAGLAGVPSDATAVVIDLSEIFSGSAGNATVYAEGAPQPDTTSVTFPASWVGVNQVTTQVNPSNGEISILDRLTGSGVTYPTFDVVGYYGPNETYNGAGERMTENIGTTTEDFTYDNVTAPVPAVLQDATYFYVYGPTGPGGQQLPVEEIPTGGGSPIYLHHDQLGSTVALTDSTGGVVGTESYSDYGSQTASTGSATSPLGYAGAYTDSSTGYLYLFNRFYDPTTGQFLSVDPLVGITGQPYGYAGNDPVNGSDPSGLCRDWFDSTCDSQNAAWIVKSESAPGGLVRVNEKQAAGLLNSNHWSKGDIGPTVNSFDWSQPVYIKAVDGSVTWWRYSSSAKSPVRLAFGTPNVLTIPQVAVSVLDLNPRFNNASYFWALSPNTITVVLYGHIARSAGGAGLQIVAPEWANKIDVVGGPVHTWNSESLVSQYEQTPNPPSPGYGLSSDLGGGCTISV